MSFWQNAFGGTHPAPEPQVEIQQSPQPWYIPQSPQPQGQYQPQQWQAPAPQIPQQSSSHSARCPNCGSGNFLAAPMGEGVLVGKAAASRCYDCGFNGLGITNTSSSAIRTRETAQAGAPVARARQVSTGNNFNPNVIVGKV